MKNLLKSILLLACFLSLGNLQAGDPKLSQTNGFTENCGQISNQFGHPNDAVKFLWSTNRAMNVQIKNASLSYDSFKSESKGTIAFHRLDMRLKGASQSARMVASNYVPGETHYAGKLKGQSIEHVSTADQLLAENVYPGVDWKLNITESGNLKYDFIVREQAALDQIQLEYKGFDHFELCDGALHFTISGRTIVEHIPASWVSETGEEVAIQYHISHESADALVLSFQQETPCEYDGTLVIDPEAFFEWGTYYGDSLYDVAQAVAVDSLGNVFVVGTAQSYSSVASEGSHQGVFAGGDTDAYLVKFNQHGLRHWATYYGGAGDDAALAIDLDNYQTVYLAGITMSDTIVRSDSTFQVVQGGLQDGFIASFNRDGILIWDSYIGGSGTDAVTGVIADNRGNVYVSGYTDTPDFLGTDSVSPAQPPQGLVDGFIARFGPEGQLSWCTYFGGAGDDYLTAISLDSAYSAYAVGYTNSPSGIVIGDAMQPDFGGGEDGLIVKIDSSFIFQWATYFGGSGNDRAYGVTCTLNKAFVAGSTDSQLSLSDTLSFQDTLGGGLDGYLLSLNTDGSLAHFSYLGGEGDDEALDICHDYEGDLYITGYTRSDSAMASFDAERSSLIGETDAFINKFDPLGNRLWGTYHGGEGNDRALGIAVLGYTAVYPVGITNSNLFIAKDGTLEYTHQPTLGDTLGDGFIGRYTQTLSTAPIGICPCPDGSGGGGGGYGGGTYSSPPPIGICIGDSLELSVGGGALGIDAAWIWYQDTCGETDNFLAEGSSIWVSPTVATSYFVRAESVNCITRCQSVTVNVDYPPTALASVNDSICPGESLEFFADGALTYEWSGPNEFESLVQNPLIDSVTVAASGDYQVIAITQFGCRDTAEVNAFVFDSPQFQLSATAVSCFGGSDGSVSFSTTDSTIIDYQWVEFPNDSSTALLDLSAGNYSAIATNAVGCQSLVSVEVTQPKRLIDSLYVFPAYCDRPNGGIQVYASGGTEPYNTLWTPGDMVGLFLSDAATGSYTIVLTDAEGCTDTSVGYIPNLGQFTAVIEPDTMILEYLAIGTIDFYTTPEVSVDVHNWAPPEAVSCVNCPNPDINPAESQMLYLTLSSDRGCFSQDSIYVVRLLPDPAAFVPNRFSPNGDGLNDQLCVEGFRMLSFNFQLFDRTGAKVFESNDTDNCWDGRKNGEPINGPMLYTFEAVLEEGQTVTETGQIVILR